jgi:hypothetical protein
MSLVSVGAKTEGASLVAAAMNLAVDATASEVVSAFRDAGVPCIVLKGPSLTEWLYGHDSDRASVDVDLLISVGVLDAAEDALRALGYEPVVPVPRPSGRPGYARVWHRPGASPNVDLHTTIVGIGVSSEEAWSVLAENTHDVTVGRTRVEAFAPGAQAFHLALHAAKHGVRHSRPLRDLARAVDTLLPEVWRDAAALAVRLDAVPAFTTGLSLVPRGEDLTGRLGLVRGTSLDAALRKQTAPALSLGIAWLAELPGWRAKAAFVAGKVVPPAAYMRRWHPLARRGQLGLAAAYAYRPIWFLINLGPAIAAWRRAKSESQ